MSKTGKVTQVIGAVVDVSFEEDLPEIPDASGIDIDIDYSHSHWGSTKDLHLEGVPSYKTTLLLWQKLSVWVKLLNPNLKRHDKAEDNTVSILQLLVTKQKNVIEDKVDDSSRYEWRFYQKWWMVSNYARTW